MEDTRTSGAVSNVGLLEQRVKLKLVVVGGLRELLDALCGIGENLLKAHDFRKWCCLCRGGSWRTEEARVGAREGARGWKL